MRYKRIKQFCAETGYTEEAVRGKIRAGVWLLGKEYRKAPDGHILIDCEGYEAWVEQQAIRAFAPAATKASKSTSDTVAKGAARRSSSPQPLQI